MSRKRTGLRNKRRTGRSTYSLRDKARVADSYGTWVQCHATKPEIVASHTLTRGGTP